MKKLVLLLMIILLAGCATLEYQQSYKQVAPTKYPRTTQVMLFEYRNVNIHELYDLFFSDYLIIGKTEFVGPFEDPKSSVEFAKSIGADIFISSSQFKETRTSYTPILTPTSSTSYFSGNTQSGPFFGTSNNYGTRTTMVPVYIDRYNQNGIYLKNINNVIPLWGKKRTDYKETESNSLTGIWFNEDFDLRIYKSGIQMIAVLDSIHKTKEIGIQDDLKLLFNLETGAGVYMMSDKTPQPVQVKLNKFGNLQVDITSLGETVSFARRK